MKRKSSFLLAAVILAACSPEEEKQPSTPPVRTFVLEDDRETPFRRFPGEVAAADTSQMSFDVPGRLIEFPATQGLIVKAGDLLGRLDDENFQSRLASAEARLTSARDELERRRQLRDRGVVSQSDLDQAIEQFQVAEAQQREAKRNVKDTEMRAPFDGRVARTLVNNFQNVNAKQPILVYQNLSGLEVDIHIPEADMVLGGQGLTTEQAREILEAKVEFPTVPGRTFDLDLKSFATDANPTARTFRVTFNLLPPEGINVLPGMTSTVLVRNRRNAVVSSGETNRFLIPVGSLSTDSEGARVWLLDPETLTVSAVPVITHEALGDSILIESGKLQPGMEIVSSGVRFLHENMAVRRMR